MVFLQSQSPKQTWLKYQYYIFIMRFQILFIFFVVFFISLLIILPLNTISLHFVFLLAIFSVSLHKKLKFEY